MNHLDPATIPTFTISEERCSGCGLCAEHCSEAVIRCDGEGPPTVGDAAHCLECGHCSAICPSDALHRDELRGRAVTPPSKRDPDAMERLLAGKRSCRHFRDQPLERAALERLVEVASLAPSSKNSEERCFIVVSDGERLAALRRDLVRYARRIRRLLGLLVSWLLRWALPKESVHALRRMCRSFDHMFERDAAGEDAIFYDAPAVLFIGGIGPDPFGKDNALAAQHYALLQAEAMGLGSCIIGYAQAAPKVIARHLEVPPLYTIYGVIALGHPRYRFSASAPRKVPQVSWVSP